jgi:hypothetical protein
MIPQPWFGLRLTRPAVLHFKEGIHYQFLSNCIFLKLKEVKLHHNASYVWCNISTYIMPLVSVKVKHLWRHSHWFPWLLYSFVFEWHHNRVKPRSMSIYKAATSQSLVSAIKRTWSIDTYRSSVTKRSIHSTLYEFFFTTVREQVWGSDDKKVEAFDETDNLCFILTTKQISVCFYSGWSAFLLDFSFFHRIQSHNTKVHLN